MSTSIGKLVVIDADLADRAGQFRQEARPGRCIERCKDGSQCARAARNLCTDRMFRCTSHAKGHDVIAIERTVWVEVHKEAGR